MTSNPFLVMEGASFALDGHTVTLAIHEVFERAACIDARNDVFFDAGNQPQAKQICQRAIYDGSAFPTPWKPASPTESGVACRRWSGGICFVAVPSNSLKAARR